MIITIDGPSGTGKSTVAKRVAEKLGFTYFDTGAMFRALAYGIIRDKIHYHDEKALAHFLQSHPVSIRTNEETKRVSILLNDVDVTEKLRYPDVTELSSKISTIKAVRDTLAATQRKLSEERDSVFEGRDMGTVIFPQARLKIFLTADPEIRAERRHQELVAKGALHAPTKEQTLKSIIERDERDSTRDLAPLKAAADAHIIDTTHLTIDEVVGRIVALHTRL